LAFQRVSGGPADLIRGPAAFRPGITPGLAYLVSFGYQITFFSGFFAPMQIFFCNVLIFHKYTMSNYETSLVDAIYRVYEALLFCWFPSSSLGMSPKREANPVMNKIDTSVVETRFIASL
jgi:hypothetical protein